VVFDRLGVEGRERLDQGRGREREGVGGGWKRLDDARRVGGVGIHGARPRAGAGGGESELEARVSVFTVLVRRGARVRGYWSRHWRRGFGSSTISLP
jgi:hypothetical protein